jgi:outer membrane lipase/esterase
MKTVKRAVSAALLFLFATVVPTAHAQLAHFSDVVVFGDSLSDAGYYRAFLASRGLPAPLVATLGRFTTNPGPVWSELVSQFYGVTPAPSNAGGSIYAQGGARVALSPGITPQGLAERPVSVQINEYLAAHGGAADPNALFAVWAIANDFFVNNAQLGAGAITAAQFQANLLGAATAEAQQVGRLFQAGARHVLVFAGFDPTLTPAVAGLDAATRGGLQQLTVGVNTTLFSGLAGSGFRPIPVDLFTLFNEIRVNPSSYGFTNITGIACAPFPGVTTTGNAQFCYSGNLVAPNADRTFLFADASGHLTTGGHALVAQFVESLIEGPTAYSLLAETPLRTRAAHVRTLEDGLLAGSRNEVGRLTVFAAGDRGNFDVDAGANTKLQAGSLGLTARVSEAVAVGLAVGKATSDGRFPADMGGYRTSETVWSAFATMSWRGLYGTAIASLSDINFTGVSRNIALGAATRTAASRPQGSNASMSLNLGYDFPLGALRIGPVVGFTSQDVDVNQFDEEGAGSANLRIGAQKRRSEVVSAGVRASLDLGRWTPWLRITADKERKGNGRVVTATPLSVASLNSYDVDALSQDTSFMTGAVGIRGTVWDRVGLSLAYFKVSGRSGIKEDGVSGLLSYRF